VTTSVELYVARLDAALQGPRRRKADLLAEARDSLIDATEALEAEGLNRSTAERRAVEEFGDLDEVVPGYRTELGFAQGRRTAVLMVAVMLAQPIIWLEDTWRWNQTDKEPDLSPAAKFLNEFIETFGSVVILAAVLGVIATGIGVRLPLVRKHVTRVTAVLALTTSVLMGFTAISLAVLNSSGVGGVVVGLLWVSGFVLLPLTAVGASAHRCLRLA
jgi:hypothetical protein